jgi:Tol biopolymer transport system component
MGVVYLADDTRLGRKVALKLLAANVTSDAARLKRFEQEARAASALNHPNILTIFEVGQADGKHYIAAEYVEGETLRQRLGRGRLARKDALDVAIQVGTALAAAHKAGIVHRDVKPENVILRPDGYAKVLDFGLAKLSEPEPRDSEEAPTLARIETDPGTVLGTATYMSPEQACGEVVDQRSDIFSLGVVLYEMLTGAPPFRGGSTAETMASILKTEPEPLARAAAETPPELQRIVSKALRKDREERYQFVKEMVVDLKAVRRELEGGAGATTGISSPAVGAPAVELPTPAAAVPTVSSAEYLVGEMKRHPWVGLAAAAALLAAFAGAALAIRRSAPRGAASPAAGTRIVRLTNIGRVGDAAISPDGRYMGHVVFEHGKQGLALRQVTTNSTTTVVPPGDDALSGPTFSRDGDYLYYLKSWGGPQTTFNLRALYRVPILGGTVQKVLAHVSSPISFSPDGKKMAFDRLLPGSATASLLVANTDGSDEVTVATRDATRRVGPSFGMAWSPDGKVIAWPDLAPNGAGIRIVLVPLDGSAERQLGTHMWRTVNGIAWVPDGTGLLVTGFDEDTDFRNQVFSVSYPDGQTHPITNDVNGYVGVSVTADSSKLLTVATDGVSRLWVSRTADVANLKPISSGRTDGYFGVSWTPDGRIVHANRDFDLWMVNADGADARLLTPDSHTNRLPAVSPDGRYIVFESWRGRYARPPTTDRLWRIDTDGGNPTHLPAEGMVGTSGLSWPQFTPDGRTVIYEYAKPQVGFALGRISIDGKDARQLTHNRFTLGPAIAPDGTRVAAYFRENPTVVPGKLGIFPIDGGDPVATFEGVRGVRARGLRWTPDGRALTYFVDRGGTTQIWEQLVAGGPPRMIADFDDDFVFWHDWSRDGRLALSRGRTERDAVLITNFR